jgi:hypothetical protein
MRREWMREDSKPRMGKAIIQRKKQKHRRRRETRSGPGPWYSTPNPNPTGTPAPAKFKLGKQPAWTAYASPNVAERGRKELQNNARTTAVWVGKPQRQPRTRRKRRAAEEPELWVHRMRGADKSTSTINESGG